ncbi:MAG: hypothetical protein ACOZIN_08880 [Myxococcota bacterium]
MRPLALFFFLLACGPSWARAWNGIEPGVSTRHDVVKKFGEPSKVVSAEGRETLAYSKAKAIRGTTQAQFRVDTATQKVARIDVFPSTTVDREAIEESYGGACPDGPKPKTPCYVKKTTPDQRTYFHYVQIGLVVFFQKDGQTVQSIVFQPSKT